MVDRTALGAALDSERRAYMIETARRDMLIESAVEKYEKADELGLRVEFLRKVYRLLRTLAAKTSSFVRDQIDPLGREAVQELFGPEATFSTEFSVTASGRGKAAISTGIGEQKGNPLQTDGLSVAQTVSDGILRPLVVAMYKPPLSRILMLDEPFSGIDGERMERLAIFLKKLSVTAGIQWVITTHDPNRDLDAQGTTIELTQQRAETRSQKGTTEQ